MDGRCKCQLDLIMLLEGIAKHNTELKFNLGRINDLELESHLMMVGYTGPILFLKNTIPKTMNWTISACLQCKYVQLSI